MCQINKSDLFGNQIISATTILTTIIANETNIVTRGGPCKRRYVLSMLCVIMQSFYLCSIKPAQIDDNKGDAVTEKEKGMFITWSACLIRAAACTLKTK